MRDSNIGLVSIILSILAGAWLVNSGVSTVTVFFISTIGLLFGIIGLLSKRNRKRFSVIGVTLNVCVISVILLSYAQVIHWL